MFLIASNNGIEKYFLTVYSQPLRELIKNDNNDDDDDDDYESLVVMDSMSDISSNFHRSLQFFDSNIDATLFLIAFVFYSIRFNDFHNE